MSTNEDSQPLQGKVAIVTGASSGIGQAVARELAGLGAKVLVTAGREERLTELHQRWPVHPTESMEIPHPHRPEDVARCVRFLLTQPRHVRIPRLTVLPGEHVI